MPTINMPRIAGAFALNVNARFDGLEYGPGQTVLDIGDAAGRDNIMPVQSGTTATPEFVIVVDGARHTVAAPNAIVAGETAVWSVLVDESWVMRLGKKTCRGG